MSLRVRFGSRLFALAVTLLLAFGLGVQAAPVVAQDEQSVTVQLAPENESGVTGTATFSADGDQTILDMSLTGSEPGYEGHMFDSTCDDHRGATVFYAINAVDENGQSTSTIDAPLSELTSGDYWIHMHRPAGEQGEGVACGQVLAASGVGGGPLPSAGVGPFRAGGSNVWLLIGVVAATSVLLGASRLHRAAADSRS